jgi:hypothetical protein
VIVRVQLGCGRWDLKRYDLTKELPNTVPIREDFVIKILKDILEVLGPDSALIMHFILKYICMDTVITRSYEVT